jgi:hypothetical protein
MDRRLGRGTGSNDGVEKDGGVSGSVVRIAFALKGEIVVVLDGLEGELLAEETEVVDGDWGRKKVVDCCRSVVW